MLTDAKIGLRVDEPETPYHLFRDEGDVPDSLAVSVSKMSRSPGANSAPPKLRGNLIIWNNQI